MIFIEIPLFYNSFNKTTVGINIVGTNETKNGERTNSDADSNITTTYEQIPYQLIRFYDADTNCKIGSIKVENNDKDMMRLYTDITGKEFYIEYFPFFIYSSKFRYIRDNNDTN